jgi:hypothetical protein
MLPDRHEELRAHDAGLARFRKAIYTLSHSEALRGPGFFLQQFFRLFLAYRLQAIHE